MSKIAIYGLFVGEQPYYVGQSRDVQGRFYKHLWALKKGTHENDRLQKTYNKYGDGLQFRVIEELDTPQKLTERERYWIRQLRPKCNFMLPTVENWTLDSEAKAKISEKISGERNGMWGKHPWNYGETKNTNASIRKVAEHLSKIKKGVQPEHLRGLMDEEMKKKISIAHTGKHIPEEIRHKMSESSPRKRAVRCVETGEIFASAAEAAKAVGCKSRSPISAVCKKRKCYKTCMGFHWEFYEEN